MVWQVAIPMIASAVGNMIKGRQQSAAARRAAARTQRASEQQQQYLEEGYGRARELYDPILQGGMGAYDQILAQMGMGDAEAVDYMGTPMAQAMQQQFQRQMGTGMEQIQNVMAGQGRLYSGDTSRAIADYMGKYTPDYYGAYMGGLGQLAQEGMSATGALAGLATGQAGAMGNIEQQRAQAMSEYDLQRAQQRAQGIDSIIGAGMAGMGMYQGNLQHQQMMNLMQQQNMPYGAASMPYGGMNAYQMPTTYRGWDPMQGVQGGVMS